MDPSCDSRPTATDPQSVGSRRWKRRPKGQGAKGKQVHICSELHNGEICGKVYSRAEHLRRHHIRHHSATFSRRQSLSSSGTDPEAEVSTPCRDEHSEEIQFAELGLASAPHEEHTSNSMVSAGWMACPQRQWSGEQITQHEIMHVPHFGNPQAALSQSTGLKTEDEMKLMCYWIEAYKRMFGLVDTDGAPSEQSFYVNYTPKLCSENEEVRDIVLSIASSHMELSSEPSARQKDIGEEGYHKALVNHRQKVQQLASGRAGSWSDTELETAVFMSYLLSIRTIINTQHMEQKLTDESLFNQLLLRQILIKGYHNLYRFAFPRIKSRPLPTLLLDVYADQAGLLPEGGGPMFSEMDVPIFIRRQHFAFLLDCFSSIDIPDEVLQILRATIRLLDWIFEAIQDRQPSSVIQARWLIMNAALPDPFVKLLQSRHPRAMAIYAHLVALETLPGVCEIWWLSGNVKARVAALKALTPSEWQWAFEWPMNIVTYGAEAADFPGMSMSSSDDCTPEESLSTPDNSGLEDTMLLQRKPVEFL